MISAFSTTPRDHTCLKARTSRHNSRLKQINIDTHEIRIAATKHTLTKTAEIPPEYLKELEHQQGVTGGHKKYWHVTMSELQR